VSVELLAEPEGDGTEHHDGNDLHDVSPAGAELARRGDWLRDVARQRQ
jgi:hypothetical protein